MTGDRNKLLVFKKSEAGTYLMIKGEEEVNIFTTSSNIDNDFSSLQTKMCHVIICLFVICDVKRRDLLVDIIDLTQTQEHTRTQIIHKSRDVVFSSSQFSRLILRLPFMAHLDQIHSGS